MREKHFYRNIHPNLFSDSVVTKKGKLSPDMFGYYLDNLTSQSKEKEFEEFCRGLVKVTICPNLLPQTGPTGGGDSKVDSETYPVSYDLAKTWMVGFSDEAYSERWAFAISATKKWRSKCKSDVAKIIKTNEEQGRDYKKIFFLTNQYVSDKKRADLEDDFRKKYQIDVRILDKTWLIDNTFKDNNVLIAIDSFNMSDALVDEIDEGNLDRDRKKRLDEIEEKFTEISFLRPSNIVKLSKESIELMRELEISKSSMINYLERNLRLSYEYGHKMDYFQAIYDYAWTILWWYEDRDLYYKKYVELEDLFIQNSENYALFKKVYTLWISLYSNHMEDIYPVKNMDKHKELIISTFEKYINDDNNPNRALLARYDYQMIRLQFEDNLDSITNTYIDILKDLKYNIDIDLNHVKDILTLPILKNTENYNELFELVIERLSEYSADALSSEMLVSRGDEYLKNRNLQKSINYYSRALEKLYRGDSNYELAKVLYKIGNVFESLNLLWAARSYFYRSYYISFHHYFDSGKFSPSMFLSLRHIKFIELKFGRLENSLRLNEHELIIFQYYPYEINEKYEIENYYTYDIIISALILGEEPRRFKELRRLPDFLEDMGLSISSLALKYRLGISDENFVEVLGNAADVDKFMNDIINKVPLEYFVNRPSNNEERKNILYSKIFGCEITIRSSGNILENEFASSILALFENVFAIVQFDEFIPIVDSIEIEITSDNSSEDFDIEVEISEEIISVDVKNINVIQMNENQEMISEKLLMILGIFISKMTLIESNYQVLKNYMDNKDFYFRVFNHSSTLDIAPSLLEESLMNIDDYKAYPYENIRVMNKKIDDYYNKISSNDNKSDDKENFSNGDLTHADIFSKNIINMPLWDKANWQGIFAIPKINNNSKGCIGLIFDNEYGLKIFKEWKTNDEKVSVGIITGIDENNPTWYRVVIGYDYVNALNKSELDEEGIYNMVCRIQTMETKTTKTIDILKKLKGNGDYIYLYPIISKNEEDFGNHFDKGLILDNEQLIIKDVKDIDKNDYFIQQGILPTDKPFFKNKPNEFLLDWIKKKKNYQDCK
ncbi:MULTISPECIES: hypothetical protein [Aerococcus]|uniref:hypothetical protein n=1 Tax=Aerococcus TaxID=1375 RepID=UPI000DCD7202|nr:hypothetical protein [Aerococcus urinae]RAV71467.1 hypothetical protein DBT40_03935 [Aerococcus urinae]RAW05176.1 hypothetical protein DBT41_04900 [Aerococcus urinae]